MPKCQAKDCTVKNAVFNFEGEKKGIYCGNHKKDGMIDVKSPRCLDCESRSSFNYEGQKKGLYCVTHKKDGMIDVKNPRCKSG